jgi:hypothetical protein
MKRIAAHVNTYCTFCRSAGTEKVKAIWRISYDHANRACEAHKADLQAIEDEQRHANGHYSEADYQTWMRL